MRLLLKSNAAAPFHGFTGDWALCQNRYRTVAHHQDQNSTRMNRTKRRKNTS
jgi:hypothetical protein